MVVRFFFQIKTKMIITEIRVEGKYSVLANNAENNPEILAENSARPHNVTGQNKKKKNKANIISSCMNRTCGEE